MSFNVEILETSFNKLKPCADEFAASFYKNLFQANPEIKPLFANTDMPNQHKKLLSSLVLVVENLRNPEALTPVLHALGARHISYGAIPKYYDPVVQALLVTLAEYLPDDWNPEVKTAWHSALRAVCALMLKGTGQETVTQPVPKEVVPKPSSTLSNAASLPYQPSLAPSPDSDSTNNLTPDPPINISANLFPSIGKPKKAFIVIQLDSQAFKEVFENLIVKYQLKYQQIQSQIAAQPLSEMIQQVPQKFVNLFWIAPTWLVTTVAVVVFTLVIVITDSNSFIGKALGSTESIGLLVALVLFVKEIPDRRKQFHYQAWSTVDAAHNVKVSYARILALQDLNADGISLRGLDAPNAELVEINLPKANLSRANLQLCDLSNANLSYANLDNANLSQTQLSGANLSRANLGFANLSHANLSSTNFNHANLICTNLSHTNLSGANLQEASLSGANLTGAYLTGANLKNAKVSSFDLSNAFLEGAIMPDGSKYAPPESQS
jgi:uncharacterized protein YjbI with pentapeptide repeats/hemoglobin-like flavoprotein